MLCDRFEPRRLSLILLLKLCSVVFWYWLLQCTCTVIIYVSKIFIVFSVSVVNILFDFQVLLNDSEELTSFRSQSVKKKPVENKTASTTI